MSRTRRTVMSMTVVAAAAAAVLGVGAAVAQDDAAPMGTDPAALLERLDELELALPVDIAPTDVDLDESTTWGTLSGDATSVRAVLDTLEPDLRRLFVDADDADGEVAAAVALVARGWLDVWTGTAAIGAAESNDLAFPMDATDALGVAAGADELRGSIETGLELVLQGRDRHLEGYHALRELDQAEPQAQGRIVDRANAATTFEEELRPDVVALLSQPSTMVLVPTERFVTDAPGVRSRAASVTVVCVDRDELEAAGGVATEEVLATLTQLDLDDEACPALPESLGNDPAVP